MILVHLNDENISTILQTTFTNLFPKYGADILSQINDAYAEYWVPDPVDGPTDYTLAFQRRVKALCRRYAKLEEAEDAFFDHAVGDRTTDSAQTTTTGKTEVKYNAVNTPISRLDDKTETNNTVAQTAPHYDGREWAPAISDDSKHPSPIAQFVDAFGMILLFPEDYTED